MHATFTRIRPTTLVIIGLGALAIAVAAGPRYESVAQSADFWGSLGLAYDEVEHFSSLGEMAKAADAVVLGAIEDVSEGRVFGEQGDTVTYASAIVRVERLLRGSLPPEHSKTLTLEVMLPMDTSVDMVRAQLPPNRSVFFLRNKGVDAQRFGHSPEVQTAERPYYRLVVQRGVVADVNGRATAPGWTDTVDFMSNVEGKPFDEVVAQIGH